MGKKTVLFLIVALVALCVVPAVASADLVNEYGMHFAGQTKCLECHDEANGLTVHGRMARPGVFPEAPASWTMFRAAGDAPEQAGTKGAVYDGGGHYELSLPWVTLGDNTSGLATEYLFWNGGKPGDPDPVIGAPNYGMPWNLVEGLTYEPGEGWVIAGEEPERGLYDVVYGCQRCHQLGTTNRAAAGETIPNPAVKTAPDADTPVQWARDAATTKYDFMKDAAVSQPGMSIQCEACHGTGELRSAANGDDFTARHWNSGTQISNRYGDNTFASTLGNSQVCGQCHGSYINSPAEQGTNVQNNLGVYGYTPNLPFRLFGDINGAPVNKSGVQTAASYTEIPSAEDFLANPTWYWMFPNGSNAKGNHYYYDEWAASAHSYRAAYAGGEVDPDEMAFQAAGNGRFSNNFDPNLTSGCYKCHTGEGYLYSKNVIGQNSESGFLKSFTPSKATVGFMGQECTTCHGGHPASLDESDVVREPDQAGQRSAAGWPANQSICEDCHNWQMEVQGLTPNYKPMADITAHGGPSHPQRETRHSRAVMVDTDDVAEQFMPGAKCEDCHMPKTNKGANRYSHGMKPMLPGEADEWMTAAGSAYMGEDSCTKCHGGQNRSELQEDIDTWQEETKAQAEATAEAITAAQTRSEYSLTDSTKPGYVLVGRATWNYKAWENDASEGVHNPEYIMAGLEKAEQMAMSVGGSFAAVDAPLSVLPGTAAFVSGKVVNGDGSPAAGATLQLYADGVYAVDNENGATVTSADNGTFAFLVKPTAPTSYTVVWERSGNAATNLTSAAVTVEMAKIASTTTLKASKTAMLLGKKVKLTVTTAPVDAGAVTLQYRKGAGVWKTFTTLGNPAPGTFTKSFKPTAKGTWSFKASCAATATVASSKSLVVKVKVK